MAEYCVYIFSNSECLDRSVINQNNDKDIDALSNVLLAKGITPNIHKELTVAEIKRVINGRKC